MHRLTSARVIAGSLIPAEDGATGAASRCVIEDGNGKRRSAFVKQGPPNEVASEALASVLLSGWGLPVPEPFIVVLDGAYAFASADVSYPNLKQRFNVGLLEGDALNAAALAAMQTVASFPSTPRAAAYDEAIDNRDRNLGNVLWDGTDEVWIDHAYCFGIGNQPDENKLCRIAVAVGETETVQRGALAAAMVLDRELPLRTLEETTKFSLPAEELVDTVVHRLATIGARLLARFPQPSDLLTGVR